MAGKKRFTVLRKLKLVPAALMSIIILAALSLLGLLNFTPPSLDDSSSDASQEAAEEVETDTDQQALVSMDLNRPPAAVEEDVDEQEKALQPLDLVDVLIDGDTYWFGIGMRDEQIVRQQKTIGEIVTASQQSGGDASGVKIRVTRTFDATAQAERVLIEALSTSGLSDDEIDQRRTLVERPSDPELAK